jgi:hypothetical protein
VSGLNSPKIEKDLLWETNLFKNFSKFQKRHEKVLTKSRNRVILSSTKEVTTMKPNNIIKEIMKLRGHNARTLAERLGKSTASYVSNPLSREKGMRMDTFIEMVEAMDCEIIIRSKLEDKSKWSVGEE